MDDFEVHLAACGNMDQEFTHPPGTHDDLVWAFALAVYAYPGPTDWMGFGVGVRRQD